MKRVQQNFKSQVAPTLLKNERKIMVELQAANQKINELNQLTDFYQTEGLKPRERCKSVHAFLEMQYSFSQEISPSREKLSKVVSNSTSCTPQKKPQGAFSNWDPTKTLIKSKNSTRDAILFDPEKSVSHSFSTSNIKFKRGSLSCNINDFHQMINFSICWI